MKLKIHLAKVGLEVTKKYLAVDKTLTVKASINFEAFVFKICFHNFVENQQVISRKHLFIFLSIITILFSCSQKESAKIKDQQALKDSLFFDAQKTMYHQALDSVLGEAQFNGIISIAVKGKKVFETTKGYSNFKTKKEIDSATVFAIASISKQFVAVILLKLQEEKKLNLHDKVSSYLDDYKINSYQDITISQLIHHTSGVNFIGEKLMFKPGSNFHYSNDGYKSLGDIIEKATGKSYDENVVNLFGQVRMSHSSTGNIFHGDNFASAYLGALKDPKEVDNMPKRLDKNHISIAAGGLLSTAGDLHLWNAALYSGKLLSAESLVLFLKPEKNNDHYILGKVGYACGIMIDKNSPKTYLHTGYVKGAPSLNIYYPDTKTSVVILSNIADERLGKKAIYSIHKKVKELVDDLQKNNK